eukprot:m.29814 g.29814  ORF g.29814 m.29814 type:complete len:141 (+) comp12111_c0_seq1:666-1088(+)
MAQKPRVCTGWHQKRPWKHSTSGMCTCGLHRLFVVFSVTFWLIQRNFSLLCCQWYLMHVLSQHPEFDSLPELAHKMAGKATVPQLTDVIHKDDEMLIVFPGDAEHSHMPGERTQRKRIIARGTGHKGFLSDRLSFELIEK